MSRSTLRVAIFVALIIGFCASAAAPVMAAGPSKKVRAYLAQKPTDYKKLYQIARTAVKQRRYPDAMAIAKYLVSAGVRHYKVYNILGFVYYHYEAYDKAIRMLKISIQLNDDQRFAQDWLKAAVNRRRDDQTF